MKLSYRWFALITPLLCCVAMAAPMPKDKEKEPEGKKVDSGSFGIFQNGHRVGTETFSIYETGNGSVIKSEFSLPKCNWPPTATSAGTSGRS